LAEVMSSVSLGPPFFGPFNASMVLLVPISVALPVTFTTC
jgi:hypothetical protein